MISRLKRLAVESGAYTAGFYDLTPAEIYDIITATANSRSEDSKRAAIMAWHSAYLTGVAFNSPKDFPRSPERYFAFLREDIPAWKRSRDQMAKIAAVHNQKYEVRQEG